MAKKLCEMAYDEAINIINNKNEAYVPWFIGGNWDEKLKFAGDMFDPISTTEAIKKIKNSNYGATIWEVNGKYIVKTSSNMW